MQFEGPLFVVGMPRSGTKLLRTILNHHPQISILGVETEFLPLWLRKWSHFGPLNRWDNFQKFYEWTTSLSYFYLRPREIGPNIEARTWFEALNGAADPGSVFTALARHDADVAGQPGVIWGDKSPSYIRSIPILNGLFPQACFIHIVRDVRDYAMSLRRAFGKDMLRASQRWADDVAGARMAGLAIGDRYTEVRYEDLISNPQAELRKLCAFIGLGYTEDMIILKAPAEKESDQQRGAGTGKKVIVSNNSEKWRQGLDADLRRSIESIACATLRSCGYEVPAGTQQTRLSALSMTARQAVDGVNLLRVDTFFSSRPEAIYFYGRAYFTGAPSHLRAE
jgi:Sulfotransferase family